MKQLQKKSTHMEKLISVQEFVKIKSRLLLIFSICLHGQLQFHNSIKVKLQSFTRQRRLFFQHTLSKNVR